MNDFKLLVFQTIYFQPSLQFILIQKRKDS